MCLLPLLAIGVLGAGPARAAPLAVVAPPPGMIEELPPAAPLWYASMALGPEDTVWFSQAPLIDRMTPTGMINGEFTIPLVYTPSETFDLDDLTLGLGGDIWFTAVRFAGPGYVGRVTSGGKFTVFELPGEFSDPAEIAMGSDGAMWFTESRWHKIERIDEVGGITEYSIPTGVGSDLPEESEPENIALGADGAIWFTDKGTTDEGRNLIGRITPKGAVSEFAIPAYGSSPAGIALGADGNMWFAEAGTNKIGRITPKGAISEFAVPSVGGSIALGSDGNMWFTEGIGADAIGRITPTGVVTSFSPVVPEGGYPTKLIAGSNGDMWFVGSHIERLVIPRAPVNDRLPVVSGVAVEGQVLSASEGSWLNGPSTFGYQWQACDASGGGCIDLGGEVAATHVLTADDVGRTLRVVVSASGVGGSASAVSDPSGVVQPAPSPPPPAKPAVVKVPLPVVSARMTWNFGWTRTYTIIESLAVHGLPAGGSLEVACRGPGCAFAHHRWATAARNRSCGGRKCALGRRMVLRGSADLTGLFKGRHLQVGARVVATVEKPGWIGKSFVFTMRANRHPRVGITCFGSGASNPAGVC
jgi:streptogramin lyase